MGVMNGMTEGRYTHGAHRGKLDRVAFSLHARLKKGREQWTNSRTRTLFFFLKAGVQTVL